MKALIIDHNPLCDAACAALVLASHSRNEGFSVLDISRFVVMMMMTMMMMMMMVVVVVASNTWRRSCHAGPDTSLALATSPNIHSLRLDDSTFGLFVYGVVVVVVVVVVVMMVMMVMFKIDTMRLAVQAPLPPLAFSCCCLHIPRQLCHCRCNHITSSSSMLPSAQPSTSTSPSTSSVLPSL